VLFLAFFLLAACGGPAPLPGEELGAPRTSAMPPEREDNPPRGNTSSGQNQQSRNSPLRACAVDEAMTTIEEHSCIHADPATQLPEQVKAATDSKTVRSVSRAHTPYVIALTQKDDVWGGSVVYQTEDAGDYLFYLSDKNLPYDVYVGDGDALAPTCGGSTTNMCALSGVRKYNLPANELVQIAFGPVPDTDQVLFLAERLRSEQ